MASLSAVVVVLRLHTFDEPLERDLTTYAYVAHRVLSGDPLYESVWDHKPPAIYAVYGLAELFFGYGQRAVAVLGTTTALATVVLFFAALRRMGGRAVAWIGATLFGFAATSTSLQANQPNVEVFLNLATVAILWAAAASAPAVAGIALAIGSLFKVNFVFFALPAVFVAIRRSRSLEGLVWIVAPGVLAWISVAAYFALDGRLHSFAGAVFGFNWEYSGGMLRAAHRIAADPFVLLPDGLREISVIGLAGAAWSMLNRRPVGAMSPWFFRTWLLATLLAVVTPGHFHPHYAQLWLPLICSGAALFSVEVAQSPGRSRRVRAPAGLGLLATLFTLELSLPIVRDLQRSPREISVAKYGPVFADSRDLARIVAERTRPDDAVFEWGSETGIYFYADRRAASPIFHLEPIAFGSDEGRRRRAQILLDAVFRERPRVIVWCRGYGEPADTPLGDLLERDYRHLGSYSFFDVYQRIDREGPAAMPTEGGAG